MLDAYKKELAAVTHINEDLITKVQMGLVSPEDKDGNLSNLIQKACRALERAQDLLIIEDRLDHLSEEKIHQISRQVEIVTEGESIFERFHCSEAFVSCVGSYLFGKVDDRLLRATTGLAGGVGGTHEGMCGALVGGVLCIGAMYGRAQRSEDDQIAQRLSAAYREAFINNFGVDQCKELREEGYGSGGHTPCGVLVGRAVKIFFGVLKDKAKLFEDRY